MKDLGLSIVIGAALAGSFNTVIGQSINQFNKVGDTIKELENQTAQIGTFTTLKNQLGHSEQAYDAARQSVVRHRQASQANRQQQVQLGSAIKAQSLTVDTAEKELAQATDALNNFTSELPNGKKRTDAMRSAMAMLKGELQQKKAALKSAKTSLDGLSKSLKAAQAQEQQLTKKTALAQQALRSKSRAVQQSRDALSSQRRAMSQSGVATTDLKNKTVQLGAAIKTLKHHQAQLGIVMRQQQHVMASRDAYKSQMIDAFALGTAMLSPVAAAVKFETVMADVNKVVDFTTPLAFKKMSDDILQLSTVVPMAASGLGDIMAAAGQAGIARNELLIFTESAAKMGVAFDIAGKHAGSAMTGMRSIYGLNQKSVVLLGDAYNHLSNNMDAQASEMLTISNRAGSVAKQFGLTGAQVGALGATFIALKTPTDVAGTAINAMLQKLGTADKQGAKFKSVLSEMGWSASELKLAIQDDAQGALLSFFETVAQSDDVMGNMVDLFGLEYSDDVTKLVGNLDLYKQALGYVADETAYAGSMQREYEVRSATTANGLTLLKNQVNRLGVTLGSVLLPPLNSVIGVAGGVIDTVSAVANTFPGATKVVIGLAMGLALMKVGAVAGGYAWTFLKGSWLSGVHALTMVRTQLALANVRLNTFTASTTAAGAATRATGLSAFGANIVSLGATLKGFALTAAPVVVGAIKSIGLALATTPIGWAVLALGAAAVAIFKYWQPVKAFFGGIWDGLVQGLQPVLTGLQPVGEVIGRVVGKIGDLLGWVGDLVAPVQMSSESLDKFASAGQNVGAVFAGLINVITAPFRLVSNLIGTAVSGIGKLASWAGLGNDDPDDDGNGDREKGSIGPQPGHAIRETQPKTPSRQFAGAVLAGTLAATSARAVTQPVHEATLPDARDQQAQIHYVTGELPEPVLPGLTQTIDQRVNAAQFPVIQDQKARIHYVAGEVPEMVLPGLKQTIDQRVSAAQFPAVQDQKAQIHYAAGDVPEPVLPELTQTIDQRVSAAQFPAVQAQQVHIHYVADEVPKPVLPGLAQDVERKVLQDVHGRADALAGQPTMRQDVVQQTLQQLQLLQPSAQAPQQNAERQPVSAPKVEHTHYHDYDITITQQPGESQDALVKRVILAIEEKQKKQARGKLYGE